MTNRRPGVMVPKDMSFHMPYQSPLIDSMMCTSLPSASATIQIGTAEQDNRNIVLISRDYPPLQCGGIATFVHALAHGLRMHGMTVHVIARAAKDRPPSEENDAGIHVHRIRERFYRRSLAALRLRVPRRIWRWSASAREAVARLAQHQRIDIVEAPIWACEGIAFLLDRRWPLITSLHTTLHTWMDINPRKARRWWWRHTYGLPTLHLETLLMTQADAIRANSRAILHEIESAYGFTFDRTHTRIIPHGLLPIAPEPSRRTSDDGIIELLFVGRFEQRKGIQVLLEALPALMQRWPCLHVRIIGEHRIRNASGHFDKDEFLERHHHADWLPRVIFEGTVSSQRLLQAYAECDIFVGPSLFESFGLVFVEAMRQGKPVIACRAGGMPEVVQDGITGLLVPPSNANSLAQAINQLIVDPDMRSRMGAAGRQTYQQHFTADQMAIQSLPLYALAHAAFLAATTQR